MQLASSIFNEKVMEDAIRDKTAMMEEEMNKENNPQNYQEEQNDEEEEKDEDFDSDFDDDSIMQTLREQRINQMKAAQTEHIENMQKGHGQYNQISEEEFLPLVTKSKFVVVHFFHKDFERCKIMDHHLNIIAKTHTETKFSSIDAEKCPFFVTKL